MDYDSERSTSDALRFKSSLLEYMLQPLSKVVLYAPPGSGKTTFVHSLAVGGFTVRETDDLVSALLDKTNKGRQLDGLKQLTWKEFVSMIPFETEVGWTMRTTTASENITWVVTNLHGRFLFQAVRNGFMIIWVKLKADVFRDRVFANSELNGEEKRMRLDWYTDVLSKPPYHNRYVSDFNELSDATDKLFDGFLDAPRELVVDNESRITTADNYRPALGRYVRGNLMLACKRVGVNYIGMGDEIESIDTAVLAGITSVHYNLIRPSGSPIMYGDDLGSIIDGDVLDFEGDGQKKLKAVNIPFYANFDWIISIGGSPGDHLLAYPRIMSKIISIDPRPMVEGFTGRWFSELFNINNWKKYTNRIKNNEMICVISDIRGDKPSNISMWEDSINENNREQLAWYNKISDMDGRVKWFSFKFRPSRNVISTDIPVGDIIMQPWVWSNSKESRIFARAGMNTMSMPSKDYFEYVDSWNKYRYQNDEVQKKQERAIGEYFIRLGDIFSHKYDVIGENGKRNLYAFNFSISNTLNGKSKDEVSEFLSNLNKRGVLVFSTVPVDLSVLTNSYLGAKYEEGVMSDLSYHDLTFRPSDFFTRELNVLSLFDIVSLLASDKDCNILESMGFISGHPSLYMWMIATNTLSLFGIDSKYQTLRISWTSKIRYLARKLRRTVGETTNLAHEVRSAVIVRNGGTAIMDSRVNGIYDGMYIAVSGHIVDTVIADATNEIIDIKSMLDSIEFNVKRILYRVTGQEKAEYSRLRRLELLEEDYRDDGIWHNYYEHVFALEAARDMLAKVNLAPDERTINYLRTRFDSIRMKYKKYAASQGWQATQFQRRNN